MSNQTNKSLAPAVEELTRHGELTALGEMLTEWLTGTARGKKPTTRKDLTMTVQTISRKEKALKAVRMAVKAKEGKPLFGTYKLGTRIKSDMLGQMAERDLMEETRVAAGIEDYVWALLKKYVEPTALERLITDLALAIDAAEADSKQPAVPEGPQRMREEDMAGKALASKTWIIPARK